ncbi:MAG: hypothetical protein RBU37_25030 [Myxococcota bacterium]|jgi:hypothetical protein|nr:hypothetical protein [Myxococcota bacterium]
MFDAEGHIPLAPVDVLNQARANPRRLVNDVLLAGTPFVFPSYREFCEFREVLGVALHVHPHAMVVRGSAHLGYSYSPAPGKTWQKMDASGLSDIDVAIADVELFLRLDDANREWEQRQRPPLPGQPGFDWYQRRQLDRRFNCVLSSRIPFNTCVAFVDALKSFDTRPFGVKKRSISAFVFRDWWSLRNRCEADLRDLCNGVTQGRLPDPALK